MNSLPTQSEPLTGVVVLEHFFSEQPVKATLRAPLGHPSDGLEVRADDVVDALEKLAAKIEKFEQKRAEA